ncbi:MAG: acetoin utilization protein AcuC [Methanomassiliicoccales archaeon]
MSDDSIIFYSDDYLKYDFGPEHPWQSSRYALIMSTLRDLGVLDHRLTCESPEPVEERYLRLVHTRRYIDFVREMSRMGCGYLDAGDTPATETLFEGALACTGGTVAAARAVAEGRCRHALNPSGGFHHAMKDKASGFCIFNDLAIATRMLQREHGIERIAIIDVDGHHGDGTQNILSDEPLLKISLHRYSPGFFPCTGGVGEMGQGAGKGYSVNVPLPAYTPDDLYLHAYHKIVGAALESYRPEIIIHQFGIDGHYTDPMVRLGLSSKAFEHLAECTHDYAHKFSDGRYVVTGGGGYNLDAVRRCWTIVACAVSGSYPYDPEGMHHLQDSRVHHKFHVHREDVERVIEQLEKEVLPLIH